MKQSSTFKRSSLLLGSALLFSALLSSCGGDTSVVPAPSAEEAETTDEAAAVLVYGPVESALYDELVESGQIEPTTFDGSQKLEDFRAVLFDGDAHEPADLGDHEGVQGAMDASKWLLVLDARQGHKDALYEYLDFASSGPSEGYLVRNGLDRHGREYAHVRHLSAATSEPQATAAFARSLAEADGLAAQQAEDVPQGLIYKTFYFHDSQAMTPDATDKYNKAGQTGSFSNTTTYTLYYNDTQDTSTAFQWLQSDVEVSSTPSNSGNIIQSSDLEQAWFQDEVYFSTTPCLTDNCTQLDSRFNTYQSSPATANGVTSVTSNVSFGVNTSDGGSFSAGSSSTREITDWAIVNQSPNDTATTQWDYHSNYLFNPTAYPANDPYGCPDIFSCDMINGAGHLHTPVQLSRSQLQASLMSVWRTNSVITDTVTVGQDLSVYLADVWCKDSTMGICDTDVGTDFTEGWRLKYQLLENFKVNFAAVVPVAIKSITFEPNPVAAEQPATGTVTLAGPAPIDYDLKLASNSPNATVLPDASVKAGQSSATFQVLTNGDGLNSGQETTATITATSDFYGYDAQAQLTVKQP